MSFLTNRESDAVSLL